MFCSFELVRNAAEIVFLVSRFFFSFPGRLFPYAEMYKWLSYGHDGKHPGCDASIMGRREFSFTLEHDIYIRYLSFHDVSEMEATIKSKCPHKIDIGALYNVEPAKRTAYAGGSDRVFAPVERELVFDIDMTDYDDIRTCCSGADICLKCWPLMNIAIKILDTVLREDFGFEHLLWVYSGRRGVHCWVCDARARRLSNEARSAITRYLTLYKGNENTTKKVSLTGPALHPALSRAYEICRTYFEEHILPNQELLNSEGHFEKVLELVPDESVRAQMRDRWQDNRRASVAKDGISASRWKQLKQALESKKVTPSVRRSLEEIIFSYTYPRIDIEVSKHMNHLLKAPFCIHPKTGRVCVPIDPQDCDNFDPTNVPTLAQLLNELNAEGVKGGSECRDLDKTSLGAPVRLFQTKFLEPLQRANKAEITALHQEKLQEVSAKTSLSW
ncbi:hypothetical protein KC19_7G017400 [Ceratodon purpureus]|uniref:DNA primase n=1 Tax=Ceratodon purpureus TaxID=3225 RepID=A0A8T0H632_CERPU|nr:hypothetical protein KC19_7G017400 [Ceratodon purpureus]